MHTCDGYILTSRHGNIHHAPMLICFLGVELWKQTIDSLSVTSTLQTCIGTVAMMCIVTCIPMLLLLMLQSQMISCCFHCLTMRPLVESLHPTHLSTILTFDTGQFDLQEMCSVAEASASAAGLVTSGSAHYCA